MQPQVAVLMGSDSDFQTMQKATEILDKFNVPHEVRVLSAHRTPVQVHDYVTAADAAGVQVFIAAAGGAAHLGGVIASLTIKPVLGVPMKMDPDLGGVDAMFSILQMPGGIPVGTLGIGSAGAKNAALLAVAILALKEPAYHKALLKYRADMTAEVLEKDRKLQEQLKRKS